LRAGNLRAKEDLLRRFIKSPSPAMVVAMIALFVSLGGVSYGVARGSITSRAIKNNSVRSVDIRNNQVRSRDIRNPGILSRDVKNESLLSADVKNGTLTFSDVACPTGTLRFESACFEQNLRGAQNWDGASNSCATVNGRLPTASELTAFRNVNGITLANQEMSSNVFRETAFRYVAVSDNGTLTRFTVNTARQYRCVIQLAA
jgi:hypothetical protein